MEDSDEDSFVWTTDSRSSEESDDSEMARGDGGKNKSLTRDASEQKEGEEKPRDTIERESRKTKKLNIKEEPPEEKVDVKQICIKKEYDSQDSNEEELDVLVKRERAAHRHSPSPSPAPLSPSSKPKKRKHISEDDHNGTETEESMACREDEENKWLKSEKKKSKKKSRNNSSVMSDNQEPDEPQCDQTNGDLSLSEEKSYDNHSKPKKSKHRDPSRSHSNTEDTGTLIEASGNITYENGLNQSSKKHKTSKSNLDRDMRKITDRITFEDDDSNLDMVENNSNISLQLKRFLQSNSALSHATLNGELTITKDDDLFLIKCPKEVDIALLEHKDLLLDNKCKFKLDGQTYDGTLAEQSSRIAVLAIGHDKSNVINLPLSGIANFRKRIPKSNHLQDNVMTNNQTNFIPLPDTKCRHPLFGVDYKKAIKIPTAVKARLNTTLEFDSLTKPEKKKKKKSKSDSYCAVDEAEEVMGVKSEPREGETQPARSKRKHRHSDTEEPVPKKKKKKIKQDPASPVAWESEKAIEKNLFDF